jgi:predicted lipoprotein
LRDAPGSESLAAARAAWKKARGSWKVTDAFLFGPAEDLAVTSGIIDTAADVAKIEELVSGTAPLDAAAVGRLGANQRGFGGVEALLFDPAKDDPTMLAAFQAEGGRRGAFGALLGSDLRSKVDAVRAAWADAPTEYGKQLAQAGRGSSVYTSERQGVDAVVNALIAAAEVLIAVRLAKPLGLDKTPAVAAPELIESPRSDASVDDVLAVLSGIEMIYLGQRGGVKGLPLADAVAERSPRADARMRDDLQNAKTAVRAIPGPLRTAVVERRDPVIAAHAAVREMKRCLTTDVAGALGTSVGFNVTDGD